jgi:hypothetical protein
LSTFQFLNKPGSTFLWKLVLVEQWKEWSHQQ